MSSFQLGLLAIGASVIAAVVIYNQWTAWRNAPKRSALRLPNPNDGPAMHADVGVDLGESTGLERREPVLGDSTVPSAHKTEGDEVRTAVLDPLIDVIAALNVDGVVSGDAVLAAMPGTRRVGAKPFFVEGLNAQTEWWEQTRPGQRYQALQAGVQLANRMGPLNEIEYSEFVVKTQAFADAVNAAPDFPEMMQEVARARELDQFASAHDAQLCFTVRATRAAWSPGYVMQHAAQLGFVAGALPGRMVLPASVSGGAPVLVLRFETQAALADDPEQSALREFHLTLDVPHVPRAERPFVRMREAAQALTLSMDGVLTDDAVRPLSNDSLDAIGSELDALYDTLQERELPAGSVLARRLFS